MEVLDPQAYDRLQMLAGGDAEFLVELINTFLNDAPQMLADMHVALERDNALAFRIAAHSLKSNSADFGATRLSEVCKQLEHLAKTGTLTGAEPLLNQAEALYPLVQSALEALRTKG